MGDHARMRLWLREDDYGNEFWAAYFRCGAIFVDADEATAVERHESHFTAETVAKPGLEQARTALEGGRDG